MRVLDGDVPLGETTADASGEWRIAVPALSPGTHTLISQELDANGNVVATSEPLTVTISEPTSIAGKIPGIKLPSAGLKADTPLELEGTGTPGTTVQVYDGDQVVGETVVAPDGTWKVTLPPLALGAHKLVAKLLGADGKELGASAPVELTVADGQIVVATPAPAAAATAVPGAGAPAIKLPAAGLAASEPLTLEGTGTPGSTVTLYDGDEMIAETTVAPDGTWTLTVPPLAAGTHSLVAKQVGADGKELGASAPVELTVADGQIVVATPAPAAAATAVPGAGAPAIKLPAAGLAASEPLTLEGTGTPGSTVTLYDGDEVIAETTVAPDGTWTLTVPPLAAGTHSLVAKQVGADGKELGASAPVELTVADGQIVVATPAPAAAATAVPGAGAPAIKLPAAGLAASEPLTLEGTGTPGSTVTLYDGDEVIAETTVAPDGTWTLTVPPLAAGTHSLVAKQVGADGKELGASAPVELTVADGQIVVATPAPSAAATAVPGAGAPAIKLPAAGLAASEPLTLEGTGTPGSTVTLYDGDEVIAETTVAPDGTWTLTVPPLAAGTHSLVAKQVGADGKELGASAPVELTVADGQIVVATPAPAAAATAVPGAGAPAIKLPAAGLAASEPLTLEGTGTPGSTVTLYDGDEMIAETTVAPDGTWTLTVPPLAAGTHSLVAKQVGADGKELGASAPVELTVADGQIVVATPAPSAAATAVPGAGAPAIKLPAAGLAASEPLTLEGTGTPGSTVTLYDGDEMIAETTVAPDGTWTLTVPPLAAGTHSLVAKQVGADGKELGASAPVELTVADGQIVVATPAVVAGTTVSPTAAAIAGAATAVATAAAGLPSTVTTPMAEATPIVSAPVIAAPVSATAEAGGTLTLEGTGAPGSTVKVYDADKPLGEATVGADGKWTMTMPMLAPGVHSLVAKLFSADGKEQGSSQALSVSVPETPGAKLSVLPVINPPAGGKLPAGRATELAGTAAPGALLKLFDAGMLLGQTTADANGNWKMSVPPLNAGEHTLTAITYGTSGEVQASSEPLTVIVSEPEAAAATGPAVQPKIGWPPDGSAVVSARPLVAGQSFPRGVVRIYDGATLLGETIADANGYWSFRPSVALTVGEHVLKVVATSADGLATAEAPPVTITVRNRAVTIPAWKPVAGAAPVFITPENGDTINTVQPLFAGTAAPNSKVRLYDGDKVMGEVAVDSDGRWTFRPAAPLAEGEHTIAVAPLNADGSEGAAKDTVTITIASGLGSAPGGPGIIVDSTPASSANSRPVLTGQAPPGATIRVYDGDQLLGEVKSGPDGNWYYAPAAPLTAGDHVLRFEVVGADGRAVASVESLITVAAGAPSVKPPQITSPSQGQAAPGDVLSGTAPAGSLVQIYDGSTLIGGTTAGANGKWRFRLPANLTAGAHVIHVVTVDQTGLPMSQSKAAVIVVAPPRTLPVTGAATVRD